MCSAEYEQNLEWREGGFAVIVYANGERVEVSEKLTVADFLVKQGYVLTKIAVELNGEVLPKNSFSDCELSDGDKLEIVHFVGGG